MDQYEPTFFNLKEGWFGFSFKSEKFYLLNLGWFRVVADSETKNHEMRNAS